MSSRTTQLIIATLFLLFIGGGVFLWVTSSEEVGNTPFIPEEPVELRDDEVEARRENIDHGEIAGEVTGTPEGEVIDSLRGSIVLLEYDYDRHADEVAGSVLNNSRQPYVNVQVGFHLLNASDEVIGTVADTIDEVGPGASQRFNIVLPMDQPVTSAMPTVLRAERRDVVGRQADPAYQQSDSLRIEE